MEVQGCQTGLIRNVNQHLIEQNEGGQNEKEKKDWNTANTSSKSSSG